MDSNNQKYQENESSIDNSKDKSNSDSKESENNNDTQNKEFENKNMYQKTKSFFYEDFRKDFFYGLAVILPSIATIWLVIFTINIISGPVSSLFNQKIPPLLSFIITIILITLLGITARNIIGKAILKFFESLMIKIPIVNIFYKSTKQIVNAFTFQNKKLLSAVLVEYPRRDMWVLGYITKDENEGLYDQEGNDFGHNKYAIFIPTTPNPTSGFLVYVNKTDVKPLSMSIEESIRLIMSAGVLTPKSYMN